MAGVLLQFPRLLLGDEDTWALVAESYDRRVILLVGTLICHEVIWILLNSFFSICDYAKLLQRFKLPRKDKPDVQLIKNTLKDIAINHIIVQPVALYFIVSRVLEGFPRQLSGFKSQEAPSCQRAIGRLLLCK